MDPVTFQQQSQMHSVLDVKEKKSRGSSLHFCVGKLAVWQWHSWRCRNRFGDLLLVYAMPFKSCKPLHVSYCYCHFHSGKGKSEKASLPRINQSTAPSQSTKPPHFIVNLVLFPLGFAKLDWGVFLCFSGVPSWKDSDVIRQPKLNVCFIVLCVQFAEQM